MKVPSCPHDVGIICYGVVVQSTRDIPTSYIAAARDIPSNLVFIRAGRYIANELQLPGRIFGASAVFWRILDSGVFLN